MRKLVKIKKDLDIVYNNNISEFIDPDYVYIPIKKNYQLLVKKGDSILKGQIIIENNLNKVVSPVSGIVIGALKKNVNGSEVPVLVIQNDFKEMEKRIRVPKEIKYDRDTIVSKLYEFYFKYIASILESKKINHLIITAIEDEPYIVNNPYILKKYNKEILEMADILTNTFSIPKTYIAIKSNDTKTIETYLSKIGMYPNISLSLVDDKYLLGKSYFLLEYMHLKEMDTLVLDAKTVYRMYNAIRYNKFTHETFVTIAGPSLAKSMVIKVKEGTSFADVISHKIKFLNKDNLFILNGLMTGSECDIENTIITQNTLGLIVIPKEEEKEYPCNRCGLCSKICPVKVNPKKVMDTKITSPNCLDCGLCSYICPCHINLRKFLRGEYE